MPPAFSICSRTMSVSGLKTLMRSMVFCSPSTAFRSSFSSAPSRVQQDVRHAPLSSVLQGGNSQRVCGSRSTPALERCSLHEWQSLQSVRGLAPCPEQIVCRVPLLVHRQRYRIKAIEAVAPHESGIFVKAQHCCPAGFRDACEVLRIKIIISGVPAS